jgi:hypothetical protein
MKKIFQQYVDAKADEVNDTEEPSLPSRPQQPASDSAFYDENYERTLGINLDLLTGFEPRKKARKITELENYYGSTKSDMSSATPGCPLLTSPLKWWLETGRHKYPTLFKVALDFLSIPSTSCDCERAFSGGRRTVTCNRNCLSGPTIAALQLQKN